MPSFEMDREAVHSTISRRTDPRPQRRARRLRRRTGVGTISRTTRVRGDNVPVADLAQTRFCASSREEAKRELCTHNTRIGIGYTPKCLYARTVDRRTRSSTTKHARLREGRSRSIAIRMMEMAKNKSTMRMITCWTLCYAFAFREGSGPTLIVSRKQCNDRARVSPIRISL